MGEGVWGKEGWCQDTRYRIQDKKTDAGFRMRDKSNNL